MDVCGVCKQEHDVMLVANGLDTCENCWEALDALAVLARVNQDTLKAVLRANLNRDSVVAAAMRKLGTMVNQYEFAALWSNATIRDVKGKVRKLTTATVTKQLKGEGL